jgi:hypothetical protein
LAIKIKKRTEKKKSVPLMQPRKFRKLDRRFQLCNADDWRKKAPSASPI